MVSTSADELEEAFMRRKRRELEQARMAGAGDAQPVQQVVRGQEKVGGTILALAGQARSIRSATGRNSRLTTTLGAPSLSRFLRRVGHLTFGGIAECKIQNPSLGSLSKTPFSATALHHWVLWISFSVCRTHGHSEQLCPQNTKR